MKKVISLILVLAMAAALFCTPAFAAYSYVALGSKTNLVEREVLDENGKPLADPSDIVVENVADHEDLTGVDHPDDLIDEKDTAAAQEKALEVLDELLENGVVTYDEDGNLSLLLRNLLLNDPNATKPEDLKLTQEQVDVLKNLNVDNLKALEMNDFYSKSNRKPITLGFDVAGTEDIVLYMFYLPLLQSEREAMEYTVDENGDKEFDWELVWFGKGPDFKVQFPDKGTYIIMLEVVPEV